MNRVAKDGDPLWSSNRRDIGARALSPKMSRLVEPVERLARQLERSQWLAASELARGQHDHLRVLVDHAAKQSEFFRGRLAQAGLTAPDIASLEALRRLPLLRRRNLQSGIGIYCNEVPARHLPINESRTSGSTGEPVAVKRTLLSHLFWLAITLREYFWHERDFKLRFTAIRPTFTSYKNPKNWGLPANLFFETGPCQTIPITTDIRQQVEWIAEFNPHVLVVFPNVLAAIVRHCQSHGVAFPALMLIRSISETLSPRLRQAAEKQFSAKIVDNYSSQEVGVIAVQCADSDLLHIMSESVIVEVLDEAGRPCREGEFGRVVVTDLHNYATPLIRYDIGDYAEVGGPCRCGRGLPTLKRILGRERNLVLRPDGTRHYPLVGFARFRDVAHIVQYQCIQDGREQIEVRLVAESPLTQRQEGDMRTIIQEALGYPFELRFTYFSQEIPRGPSGKFEEFICKVMPSVRSGALTRAW